MCREPVCRELAFKDALPDLIIGLVGIPVGFSLLQVASEMLALETKLGWKQWLGSKQWEGLIYFVFIVLLYALHSVALYMLVEVGQRLTNQLQLPDSQRRVAWQRYLVLRILGSAPFTVFVVATLAAVGVSFGNTSAQFFTWSLNPAGLIPLSFAGVGVVYAIVFTAAPLRKLLDEYPLVVPYYMTAIATGFVGSLLVRVTFMD